MRNIIDVRWPAEVFQYVALGNMARHKEPKIGESVIASIEGRKYCVPIHAVPDYWTLVTLVSRLAAVNTQYQFYFRGQTNCYVEKGVHSLPPSLWRKRDQYEHKVKRLFYCDNRLKSAYKDYENRDKAIVSQFEESPLARWALLQHYEICDTPLLDITQSLHVACSFAQQNNGYAGFVYIFGFPYQTEKTMTSTEDELTVVSLLGVTPYNARRPLIQDGYLAGPNDWWKLLADGNHEYEIKPDDYGFHKRLIAVFEIAESRAFWRNSGFDVLGYETLMQSDTDEFARFLSGVDFG